MNNNGESIKRYNEVLIKYLNDLVNSIDPSNDLNTKLVEDITTNFKKQLVDKSLDIADEGVKTLLVNAFKEYIKILKYHFDHSNIHRIDTSHSENEDINDEVNEVTSNLVNAVNNINKIPEYLNLIDRIKATLMSYFKQTFSDKDNVEEDSELIIKNVIINAFSNLSTSKIDDFNRDILPTLIAIGDSIQYVKPITQEDIQAEISKVNDERNAFIWQTMDVEIEEGMQNGVFTLSVTDAMGNTTIYEGREAVEKIISYNQLFEASRPGKFVDTSNYDGLIEKYAEEDKLEAERQTNNINNVDLLNNNITDNNMTIENPSETINNSQNPVNSNSNSFEANTSNFNNDDSNNINQLNNNLIQNNENNNNEFYNIQQDNNKLLEENNIGNNGNEEIIKKFLSNYDINVDDKNLNNSNSANEFNSLNSSNPVNEFNNLNNSNSANEFNSLNNSNSANEFNSLNSFNDLANSSFNNIVNATQSNQANVNNDSNKLSNTNDDDLKQVKQMMGIEEKNDKDKNIYNNSFSFVPNFVNHNQERDEFIKKAAGILIEEDTDNKGLLYLKVKEPTGREVIYTGKEAVTMIRNFNRAYLDANPEGKVDTSLIDNFNN